MNSPASREPASDPGESDREIAAHQELERSRSERILIMAPVGQDAPAMAALLNAKGLETQICAGAVECSREIISGAGALILTEEALEVPQETLVLHALETQPPWSELPVIILTIRGETRSSTLLSLIATAARGATLLERPISHFTLLRSLQVALTSRRRQYQVRELLKLQAQLAAIVTSSDDAIASKTLEGIVKTWNAGAERIFGYSAEEMIGQSIFRLIPAELEEEEFGILERLRRGERVQNYETIRLTKNGTRIPISLTLSPMKGENGEVHGVSKIARDITHRRAVEESLRRAKEQAEASSRAKDNFLAALSHELRTPLTPVLMTAASLREDDRLPDDVKVQMEMIERNVNLEARLIDDLLDLSRIAHGKLAFRTESCDIHSIIACVNEIICEEAREKAVTVELELKARHTTLIGDVTRLQQVFWNLLRNAVKFTPKGGHIRITSHNIPGVNGKVPGNERVCLTVSDNGIGLDPEAMKRIFEPFEQAVPSHDFQGGGLGLGLAIARAIVEKHGGSVRAESLGLGHGTTFIVEFPVSTDFKPDTISGSPPHGDPEVREPQIHRSLRLLIVEDNVPTLQALTRLLTRDGHQIVSASTLEEARAAAAKNKFDVLISDLGLPDGSGIELMKGLCEQYGLPGVALSGFGMEEDLRLSKEAGFVAHLVKPVKVEDLRQVLRHLAVPSSDEHPYRPKPVANP